MRLWHLTFWIMVAAFVLAFIRLVGVGAVATGVGVVVLMACLLLLALAPDLGAVLCRLRASAAASPSPLRPVLRLCSWGATGITFSVIGLFALSVAAVVLYTLVWLLRLLAA